MTIEEYNQIVYSQSDALYRFALKNIKVVEDAQEIVQSSFEKLWINRQQVETLKAKSYLFTVAYHQMIDLIRKENEANEFAECELIQKKDLQAFVAKRPISKTAIAGFASMIGIAPGIVVGQLQHKGLLPRSYCNELKQTFAWTSSGTQS